MINDPIPNTNADFDTSLHITKSTEELTNKRRKGKIKGIYQIKFHREVDNKTCQELSLPGGGFVRSSLTTGRRLTRDDCLFKFAEIGIGFLRFCWIFSFSSFTSFLGFVRN